MTLGENSSELRIAGVDVNGMHFVFVNRLRNKILEGKPFPYVMPYLVPNFDDL